MHGMTSMLSIGILFGFLWLMPSEVIEGGLLQKLSINETILTPSDSGSFSRSFGYAVSISGDRALVGRYQDSEKAQHAGAAYVFLRDPTTGAWSEEAKLTATDFLKWDRLGHCVSISGDTVLVAGGGSAYVFVYDGGSWTQQAKLTPAGGVACDGYRPRNSVYINNDTAILASEESAYVFVRNGTSWSQQARLTASDGAADDEFGYSVALSGDIAIVGSHQDDDACSSIPLCNSGSAYVFARDGNTGDWTEQAKLTPSDGGDSHHFGYSVAISEDSKTAVMGALYADDGRDNRTDVGAAYVFVFDEATSIWAQEAKLSADDGAYDDVFGVTVGISGDKIIVGAPSDDIKGKHGGRNVGSAYLFRLNGTTWEQQAKLIPSDSEAEDWFGQSLSISGDLAIGGARFDSGRPGTAYVYEFTSSERKGKPAR